MYLNKNIIYLILVFLYSCQPIEILPPIQFDNSSFEKISVNAKDILINNNHNPLFSDKNIEDKILIPPSKILENWIQDNISKFGNQNTFVVNIIDASIFKNEVENTEAKKYEEKKQFLYEVYFLVEFELIDDSGYILANASVETARSTTSQKYISLNETENIINDLLFNALKDFSNEAKSTLNLYMSGYMNN